jgi:hypothetical protein|tara:strand:+ start:31 stop:519 length:489 start_codon:yes stop_codon:yes gene_type:complete
MTAALCFNCGEMKFGVLPACRHCKVQEAIAPMEVGIWFSDHHFTINTLKQLGIVIKEINSHCDDPMTCFTTFLYYISQNVSDGPTLDLKEKQKEEIESILTKCTLPDIVFEESDKWGSKKKVKRYSDYKKTQEIKTRNFKYITAGLLLLAVIIFVLLQSLYH